MSSQNTEFTRKLRAAVKAKLEEFGLDVDEELPDYVMIMVGNKKDKTRMKADLKLFLGDNTTAFVEWLFAFFQKIKSVTAADSASSEKEKNVSKEKVAKEKTEKEKENSTIVTTSHKRSEEKDSTSTKKSEKNTSSHQSSKPGSKSEDKKLNKNSSHREKKIESLPSGGEANASTTFSLKTAEKAGKVTQSKVAEDKEKSVKDKPVEKTEKIRTELRPSPRIEAPPSVAARNSHPDSPPRPKISSKVVVLNKAKDDKQRTKGIIRSANHEPEDLVPMKVARREPVESKVNRFGTAERVSVHDQVDEDDDVSARQKISSKVVVMRKINEKQSKQNRGCSSIFKRAISEAASCSAGYGTASKTIRTILDAKEGRGICFNYEDEVSENNAVEKKSVTENNVENDAIMAKVRYDLEERDAVATTKKTVEKRAKPRIIVTVGSSIENLGNKRRRSTELLVTAAALKEGKNGGGERQVIVPPSSVTDASGGDAEGVKAKKPRIISLKKIKETLLAAEASDVRVAKNGSQCAGGKQRPTIKLSKLKKKENIIKIATVAAEEMKAKAKLKDESSSPSTPLTPFWDGNINLEDDLSSSDDDEAEIDAVLATAQAVRASRTVEQQELPPTAVLSRPKIAAVQGVTSSTTTTTSAPMDSSYATLGYNPAQYQSSFVALVCAENGVTKVNERCRFWPDCRNEDVCPYHHPTKPCTAFPQCWFGEKCLFIHPPCKFGMACAKPKCAYTHYKVAPSSVAGNASGFPVSTSATTTAVVVSSSAMLTVTSVQSAPFTSTSSDLSKGSGVSSTVAPTISISAPPVAPPKTMTVNAALPSSTIMCRFGGRCQNVKCLYKHPPPCRFGMNCLNSGCYFLHRKTAFVGALSKCYNNISKDSVGGDISSASGTAAAVTTSAST